MERWIEDRIHELRHDPEYQAKVQRIRKQSRAYEWEIALGCFLALAAGNFAFALLFTGEWSRAIERSYFQAIAVACLTLEFKLLRLR